MQLFWRSLWLGIGLIWFASFGVQAAVTVVTVVIVTSEISAPMTDAAEALISELERDGLPRHAILQLTAAEIAKAGSLAPKLFVALGSEAASVLAKLELRAPVLCALLPRLSFERVLKASGRKSSAQFSALYLDQPLGRQLDLIRLALPDVRRIGVLWGPESQLQAAALRSAAGARDFKLVETYVGEEDSLFKGLKGVLEEAEVLLALADPQVYNASSIQNTLLTSFRAKVPLIAFSPAYVKAGALFALHGTPEQVGRQAAGLAGGVIRGKALPTVPVYPQNFTVAVNAHVARSLALTLEAPALGDRLRRLEVTP